MTVYEAYNEVEEAAYVADEIEKLQRRGDIANLGDIAVMYRTNAQSRALEEAFVLRGMKYRLVGATRFYERKEIKDALAYLRLIHNPADSVALEPGHQHAAARDRRQGAGRAALVGGRRSA